jgi:hypothetical protein
MLPDSSIRKLADYILLNACSVNSSGLYNGKAGMALALFEAGRYLQDEYIEDRAFDLFQEALVTKNEDIGFENGLSGIGYILLYLAENGFINADFEDIFNGQYEQIIEGFENIDKQPDKLLIVPKVIFFLSELNKIKSDDVRIKSIIEKIFQGIELYLSIQFFDWNNILYIGNKAEVLRVFETYLKLVDFSGYKDFSGSLINSYTELYRENRVAGSLPTGYYLRNITTKNNIAGYDDIINNNIDNGLKNIYPSTLSLDEKLDLAKILNDMDYDCIDMFPSNRKLSRPQSNQLGYQFAFARYLMFCVNKNTPLL